MGKTIFTEGAANPAQESFIITDNQRYKNIISVDTSPKYIAPLCNNTTTPTTPPPNNSGGSTGTNIEIPVPINKGGTGAVAVTSALFNLGIDISNRTDGSILSYSSSNNRFVATNAPYKLSLDGGYF